MRRYPYSSLDALLREVPYEEVRETQSLIAMVKKCKVKNSISLGQLQRVCRWKSVRSCHHVTSNNAVFVRHIFRLSMKSSDPFEKLHILTAIKGINIPTASAILMFSDPVSFPVIDTRVWQVLYDFRKVNYNPEGKSFSLCDWGKYLTIITKYAEKHKIDCRTVEKKLFDTHKQRFTISR